MSKTISKIVLPGGLIIFQAVMLSGCAFMFREAAPTPYQPYKSTTWHSIPDGDGNILGGYTDQHIRGNRYSVTFKGNGVTDRSLATKYAHRRAEELCKEKGFEGYSPMKQGEVHDSEFVTHAGVSYPIVTVNFVCRR